MNRQRRNTWLFFGFFLLAGAANLFSRTADPAIDSFMALANYSIFIGLLLFWLETVRVRLLPSPARTCVISAAFLMLLFMLLRNFKYRFAFHTVLIRYSVYAYWIPQMLIPALFLMTCIYIRRGEKKSGQRNEMWILLIGALLPLIVMTNDLHSLVYVPHIDLSQFILDTGTYTFGPCFYLLYVWMILALVSGLGLLIHEAGHMPKRVIWFLIGMIVLWFLLVLLNLLVLSKYMRLRFFNIPEIHIFGMLGVFETCIRSRLIPYNENYPGFFRKLKIPAAVADQQLHIAYRSETELPVQQADLAAALQSPIALTPDHKLYGTKIRAGYAFWVEDESTVRRIRERLLEANEMIEQENDLIQAETQQKEKDAYLASRHRIYHEIAEELYPCQRRITQMLGEAVPGTEGFREKIALVSVLNAYVKRKTNLLLLAAENDELSIRELFLALMESANYLTLAGLSTNAREPEEEQIDAGTVLSLYDAFEILAEQLIGRASSLMISWNRTSLRLGAETEVLPDTSGIRRPVRFVRSEDILFMDILPGKDGEAA